MFVVSGVTGNTGSVVAGTLLSRGRPVTVLVRDAEKGKSWAARGAKVATAQLDDSAALAEVLKGAEGAYLLNPPNLAAKDVLEHGAHVVGKIAEAVRVSGIPQVVLLSSIGAQFEAGTGPVVSLHRAEKELGAVSPNFTAVRAPYFLTNWESSIDRQNGVLHNFLTADRKIPMISPQDIGRFAAEALLAARTGKQALEIAAPEDYSPQDIAQILGLKLQTYPTAAMGPTLTGAGFSANYAQLLQELIEGINSGHVDYEHGDQVQRGTVTAEEFFAA